MKRLYFTLSLMVVASMVLTACGSAAPATEAAPAAPAPATGCDDACVEQKIAEAIAAIPTATPGCDEACVQKKIDEAVAKVLAEQKAAATTESVATAAPEAPANAPLTGASYDMNALTFEEVSMPTLDLPNWTRGTLVSGENAEQLVVELVPDIDGNPSSASNRVVVDYQDTVPTADLYDGDAMVKVPHLRVRLYNPQLATDPDAKTILEWTGADMSTTPGGQAVKLTTVCRTENPSVDFVFVFLPAESDGNDDTKDPLRVYAFTVVKSCAKP